MPYGTGPISQYGSCGVQYKFQDQFYDMDDKVQQIKDILWKNRINHRIYFDPTNGCSRISVYLMPYEIFEEIEPIYKSCFIYNPENKLRRKTKEEFIEDPHFDLPESCRCMLRLYGSVHDGNLNGRIKKIHDYLYKYFNGQHWIHDWCRDKPSFKEKDKMYMKALKNLRDEEILKIPGIGKCTEPFVRQMRDDALSGKLKLDKKSYPYPKNKTRKELEEEKVKKSIENMAKEINSKPVKTFG